MLPPSSNAKLTWLLKLQQLSEEDLIRRAAEVQQDVTLLREGLNTPGAALAQ
jgi:hypothetical protein